VPKGPAETNTTVAAETGDGEPELGAREPELGERQLVGLAAACELLGDRWSLPLAAALMEGPLRYTEIQERLPGLAPNILTARLRRLEQERLLVATQYSARPSRFEYRLTRDGAALAGAIQQLSAWGAARADPGMAPRHEECGSALEMRWWCPACGLPVSPGAEKPILA
jgi:DNA-binding HxlR family transcriptional regulator